VANGNNKPVITEEDLQRLQQSNPDEDITVRNNTYVITPKKHTKYKKTPADIKEYAAAKKFIFSFEQRNAQYIVGVVSDKNYIEDTDYIKVFGRSMIFLATEVSMRINREFNISIDSDFESNFSRFGAISIKNPDQFIEIMKKAGLEYDPDLFPQNKRILAFKYKKPFPKSEIERYIKTVEYRLDVINRATDVKRAFPEFFNSLCELDVVCRNMLNKVPTQKRANFYTVTKLFEAVEYLLRDFYRFANNLDSSAAWIKHLNQYTTDFSAFLNAALNGQALPVPSLTRISALFEKLKVTADRSFGTGLIAQPITITTKEAFEEIVKMEQEEAKRRAEKKKRAAERAKKAMETVNDSDSGTEAVPASEKAERKD